MSPEKPASPARARSLIVRLTAALAVLAAALVSAAHFTGGDRGAPAAARAGLVHLTTSSLRGSAGHPRARPAATAAPAFFGTRPPGAKLPSSAQCAAWVRAQPSAHESKGVNKPYNRRTGAHLPADFLANDEPAADQRIVPRVNGNFTGSTREILRWVACKWGISQTIVFAQAAVESWWRQNTKGDLGTDRTACPPGHRTLNGQGQCAQSWGILQNRYPFEKGAFPAAIRSTAMNADTAYAIWRTCFDGYETWLNTVPEPQRYVKGDAWGCVGRWFSGRWHDAGAQQYIAKVRQYRKDKIWMTRDFQEP
jgi:hypothetical protein